MASITGFATPPGASGQQRPVIVGACDVCRKKKIRCDPTTRGCAQCSKYGTSCQFTPIATRGKPRRPANFKYIANLEQRLSKMEELLGDRSLALPGDGSSEEQTISRQTPSIVALSAPHHESNPNTASLISSTRGASNAVADVGVTFRAHGDGEADLSTLGGDAAGHLARNSYRQTARELGPFSLPAHQQLPTKAVALELINETFSSYFKFLPLFDEEDFLKEFQLKYATSDPGDPGWWACINVVLSLGHSLRALRTRDPVDTSNPADGYFQNALTVVSELNVSYRSLSAVQALVGMASILQGSSNAESSSVLAGAALRLAQNLNLHRECSDPSLTASQAEQRRRVFWLAYILDKDISLRLERPFSQDDDDMDVHLPSKNCAANLLNYRIGLAVIQGQVYKQLYSIQATRQAKPQRARAAQELNSSLSYWKSIAQPELADETTILPGHQISGEIVHKVVLQLTYLHCLAMIDRHLAPMTLPSLDQEPSRPEPLLHPDNACVAESRKAIRLLKVIPHRDCACVWMLLHAFFAASQSLLHNLIWNPASPQAYSDFHLVRPFLHLLETLAWDRRTCSRTEELRQMNHICSSLNKEAREAVERFGSQR